MSIQSLVKQLRRYRAIHKYIGVSIAFFITITACTGILLGWKKDSETLQPPTHEGVSSDLRQWKSFQEIALAAQQALDSAGVSTNTIDRFDVRPDKGIVKVLFKNGYWEVQVDGTSAKVLSLAQRHSDWIEHVHDGSIISDLFKLGYTNILGFGLLILAVSGFYMWYSPKVIRRLKDHRK